MTEPDQTRRFRDTTLALFHELSTEVKLLGQNSAALSAKLTALTESLARLQIFVIDNPRDSITARLTQLEEQLKGLSRDVSEHQNLTQSDKARIEAELDAFRSDLSALTEQLKHQGIAAPAPHPPISYEGEGIGGREDRVSAIIKILSDPTVRTIIVTIVTAVLASLGFGVVQNAEMPSPPDRIESIEPIEQPGRPDPFPPEYPEDDQ